MSSDIQETLSCDGFCWCPFLWDIHILFVTTTFLIYVDQFASLSSPGQIASLANGSRVNLPMVCYFFSNSIYVLLKFYFQCYHSSFHGCASIFVGQFPLSVIHFCKMSHRSFPLWEKGVTRLTPCCLCVNWITDAQWSNRLWKKGCDWSLVVRCICYLWSDWWSEELATRFVLYAITHD